MKTDPYYLAEYNPLTARWELWRTTRNERPELVNSYASETELANAWTRIVAPTLAPPNDGGVSK